MRTDYYVYGLINPKTNRLFYIGKGSGNRCKQHLTDKSSYASNKRLNGYIRNLIKENKTPEIIKFHENLNENIAYLYEESLIQFYGRKGIDEFGILLNILESGRPPNFSGEEHPWWGRKHSDESKKKMSETKKEMYSMTKHPWIGRKHTEETKRKISAKKKGNTILTDETKRKISEKLKGRNQTKTQKLAAKLANSCWWKVIDKDGKEYTTQELKLLSEYLGYGKFKLINIYHGKVKSNGIQIIKLTGKGESLI